MSLVRIQPNFEGCLVGYLYLLASVLGTFDQATFVPAIDQTWTYIFLDPNSEEGFFQHLKQFLFDILGSFCLIFNFLGLILMIFRPIFNIF